MHDSCCFCVCTRAHDVINTEEILRQITKESIVRSIISSPIEQKQRKRTRKNVSATREEVVFHSPQKCVISWPPKRRKASEREDEQIERENRTSLIPTSSSVCMCVPAREKESSVYYSSYFGSVEGEINSHHPSSYA